LKIVIIKYNIIKYIGFGLNLILWSKPTLVGPKFGLEKESRPMRNRVLTGPKGSWAESRPKQK